MIEWFAKNHVAANLLMACIMLIGYLAVKNDIGFELAPDFNLGSISIRTNLPGGNPKTVEETITTRIEEAVADLEGIKKITSRSSESSSFVTIEIEADHPQQDLLSDVKVRVDSLNTLPVDAERPIINLVEFSVNVIGTTIYGDVDYDTLFQAASDFRQALLQVDGITQVGDLQAPPREMHIEVKPEILQQYNLSLEDIGQAIQRNSLDISAGNLKTSNGDILIRSNGQAYSKSDFENIPVLNQGDSVLYIKDIAEVIDGYILFNVETLYNGKPAISVETFRVGDQNTIEVAEKVLQFVEEYKPKLPAGLNIGHYNNTAAVVEDRLTTLVQSAIQGGILVLILLSLFLRPAVAFWVGIGIPVCFLGGLAMMPFFGLSLNMLTMFAFLLVLGIVVDDAIVTGENIYRHQRLGMSPKEAALFGTKEVAVPVTFGVVTTMVAFAPLLAVTGFLSDFAAQIPLIVIPVLVFSLIESKLILPSHMSTISPRNEEISGLSKIQQNFSRGFESAIFKFYRPFLNWCISNKTITITVALATFIITVSIVVTGWLKTSFFPDFEDNAIFVSLTMPSTTGYETTKGHIERISDLASDLSNEYTDPETGESIFKYFISVSGLLYGPTGPSFGSNKGMVVMEVVTSSAGYPEGFSLKKVQEKLRNRIGDIPGVEKLSLTSSFLDFGRPISVAIYGEDLSEMHEISLKIKDYLKSYPGVFDIQDNYSNGKEEIQLNLKPLANTLGITQGEMASQVRQAVFGYEAQRMQRGHEEIKVMVRYPLEDRSSINDINNIPIRKPGDIETIPLYQLASLSPSQSPTSIYHDRQRRAITVSADIDSVTNDLNVIRADLRTFLDDLFLYEPNASYNMDGQAEAQEETVISFMVGFIVVVALVYALLAIPFKSFGQPLVVMSIIPLAMVGAMIGHVFMGLSFSMFSMMGMLGLTGIVVNDSLVLVDYINKKRQEGMELIEAVLTAGETRFRPVILTSLTTFVGLLPLMLNKSTQAQTLIPMAVSLGFGIMFATVITLIIIPVNYLLCHKIKYASIDAFKNLKKSLLLFWNKESPTV